MFFELLNIKTPSWYKAFINGRRLTGMSYHARNVKWHDVLHMTLTVYRKSGQASDLNANDADVQQRQPEPLRLTDQYIALLVLIFTKAGLLEVGY
jgi:rapamycin-insensitive companion of mTOR